MSESEVRLDVSAVVDAPPVPQGRYVAAVVDGDLAHSAGMTPRRDGRLVVTGRVGDSVGIEEAAAAARVAVRNALQACTTAAEAAGRVLARPVRMTVWVACSAGFDAHSTVADGASAVLGEVFGADRLPVRTAVGAYALPGGAPVEVELVVALAPVGPR